jgi:hypothetical protein
VRRGSAPHPVSCWLIRILDIKSLEDQVPRARTLPACPSAGFPSLLGMHNEVPPALFLNKLGYPATQVGPKLAPSSQGRSRPNAVPLITLRTSGYYLDFSSLCLSFFPQI